MSSVTKFLRIHITYYLYKRNAQKKRGTEVPLKFLTIFIVICRGGLLHEIADRDDAVVDILLLRRNRAVSGCCGERIGDHAVASLKSDFRLERILTDRTNHL